MKRFYFEIKLGSITQDIEAETEEKARELLRKSFYENPYQVDDFTDEEVELVSVELDCNLDEEE